MTFRTNQLQQLQSVLRSTIRDIQEDVAAMKAVKKQADAAGKLELEYEMHNGLRDAKAALRKFVALQVSTKQALKGA